MVPAALDIADRVSQFIVVHRMRLAHLAFSVSGLIPFYEQNNRTWPSFPPMVPVMKLEFAAIPSESRLELAVASVAFVSWDTFLANYPDMKITWDNHLRQAKRQPGQQGDACVALLCAGTIRCVPAGIRDGSYTPIADYESVDWARYLKDGTVVRR